ncbi:cupin domain-containing protein [Stakelama pacifica]|uniref:DUF985 domain-containing protein n=1 Tax=Stakelama pacifica TaxID=517720 RepID=A0A4R6FM42_9SPHN|nr:cupin domain-containing protein [Stakelama pacifica]TDN81714.1 hypothetical protein EV664_107115 [Stakelama pacifica]GGO96342.1 cupin [Stakelama pacifica]
MTEISAASLIESLGLAPHPEGGWYRETWRAAAGPDERSPGTAILFLLEAEQRSHWHRVDAEELWFWHAGAPLALDLAEAGNAPVETLLAGPAIDQGQRPQRRVPAHWWQAARPLGGWTLVSCVVVPGFDFAGFELAPPGWSPL